MKWTNNYENVFFAKLIIIQKLMKKNSIPIKSILYAKVF